MEIKLSEERVKQEHPNEYETLLGEMSRKKRDMSNLNWSYSYCIAMGGKFDYEPRNLEEAMEKAKSQYGVVLRVTEGRSSSSSRVDGFPKEFEKMVESNFNRNQELKMSKQRFSDNMNSVLKFVGKSGSSEDTRSKTPSVMNGIELMNVMARRARETAPVYPTLSDLKIARPDIYQEYIKKSDGKTFVYFQPGHGEADEWGFVVEEVAVVTERPKKGSGARIITDKRLGVHYSVDDTHCYFQGFLKMVDKAFEVDPGENFTGWNKTKQYRYTQNEIDDLIKGKVFERGKIPLYSDLPDGIKGKFN